MSFKYFDCHIGLFCDRYVGQANDPMVGLAMRNGEFPEVLVKSYKNSLFLVGPSQQFIITRVLGPIA